MCRSLSGYVCVCIGDCVMCECCQIGQSVRTSITQLSTYMYIDYI